MVINRQIQTARKQERLEFLYCVLETERKAYLALLEGGVKSFSIGSRELTTFDLPDLWKNIQEMEQEIAELVNEICGCGNKRKMVGVVPRGW